MRDCKELEQPTEEGGRSILLVAGRSSRIDRSGHAEWMVQHESAAVDPELVYGKSDEEVHGSQEDTGHKMRGMELVVLVLQEVEGKGACIDQDTGSSVIARPEEVPLPPDIS